MDMILICKQCQREYEAERSTAKYCSAKCKVRAARGVRVTEAGLGVTLSEPVTVTEGDNVTVRDSVTEGVFPPPMTDEEAAEEFREQCEAYRRHQAEERMGVNVTRQEYVNLQEKLENAIDLIEALIERVDGLEKDLKRAGFQPSKVKTVTGQVIHRIDDP